jgi:hypothetical protein
MSDEELTPRGWEVARVFLVGSAVNDVVRDHAPAKLARIRAMSRKRHIAA